MAATSAITREDLDREIMNLREVAQARQDELKTSMQRTEAAVIRMEGSIVGILTRLERAENNAMWFRILASGTFALANGLALAYLRSRM